MKKFRSIIICFFLFLWFIKPSVGQSFLNLDVAQNFSTFKFSYNPIIADNATSSATPDYSQISSTAFGLGYNYLHSTGVFATGGLGFRKAGASLVYKRVNYLWNLQYFDIKAGIGYQYGRWRVKPYASTMPYFAYLLNAKQSIGSNFYDIKADKALKVSDLGLFFNMGANVTLSQYMAIYAEYSYNLGLKNIEPAEEQYLYNRGFAVKVGLSISITNFKTMQDQIAKQPLKQQEPELDNEIEADNLQPSQFQLAGAKKNTPPSGNNVESGSSNTNATSGKTSENTDIEKIIPPGTTGWSHTSPDVPPKSKNVLTEESYSGNTPLANTSETRNSSVNGTVGTDGKSETSSGKTGTTINTKTSENNTVPVTNNTSGATNTSRNTTSASSQTANNPSVTNSQEKTQAQSKEPKSTSTSAAATYGAVPVTPGKGNQTDEIIPVSSTGTNKQKLDSDDKVVFKIQLTAVKNALKSGHPILENIKGDIKAEKGRDGWLRYYLGSYKTYEEAYKELKKIKAKGLADGGFIVAFKNSKKITVAEAKEILK